MSAASLGFCLLNEDKSVYIVIGTKKQRERIKIELENEPLMCGGVSMIQKKKDKWLGQQLSEGGLADAVAATVAAREGKIRGAGLEIKLLEYQFSVRPPFVLRSSPEIRRAGTRSPCSCWATSRICPRSPWARRTTQLDVGARRAPYI